jgi:hypothetical protein
VFDYRDAQCAEKIVSISGCYQESIWRRSS